MVLFRLSTCFLVLTASHAFMEVAFTSCTDQEVNSVSYLVSTITVSTLALFDLVVVIAVVIWLTCGTSSSSAGTLSLLHSLNFHSIPSFTILSNFYLVMPVQSIFVLWNSFLNLPHVSGLTLSVIVAFAALPGVRSCHIIARSLCMYAFSVLGSCCTSHTWPVSSLASELIYLPPSCSSASKLRSAKLLTTSYTCEWFRVVGEVTSTLAAML